MSQIMNRRDIASKERTASGIAAASGGIGLISVAHALPPTWAPIPTLLLYASPIATIFVNSLWASALTNAQHRLRQRSLEKRLQDAITVRDQIFHNPQSSNEIKTKAQANVERIQTLVMDLIMQDASDGTTVLDGLPTAILTEPRSSERADPEHVTVQNS